MMFCSHKECMATKQLIDIKGRGYKCSKKSLIYFNLITQTAINEPVVPLIT
jgi:hypothetical protein